MECPVCLNSFNTSDAMPYILPCGHTLCCVCINSLYRSEIKLCPLDRTILPDQSMVRPNFSLVETLQTTSTEEFITCCNGHNLTESITVTSKCRICKKEKESLWFCIPCHSGVCDKCKLWYDNSIQVKDSGIKCYKGHSLRLTQNAGQFYKRGGKFLCDGCKKKTEGASAHCRRCNVDICNDCLNKLNQLISMSLFVRCLCKKQVVWRCKDICGKCTKCREKFEKSGCFICVNCNKRFCIVCSYSALPR